MFTIHTAAPGHSFHHFYPLERLHSAVPGQSTDFELRMDVNVDYGQAGGPYTIRFCLVDSFGRRECDLELITEEILTARRREAACMGDVYDASRVHAVPQSSRLWHYACRLRAHFLALMQLDLFRLPVN